MQEGCGGILILQLSSSPFSPPLSLLKRTIKWLGMEWMGWLSRAGLSSEGWYNRNKHLKRCQFRCFHFNSAKFISHQKTDKQTRKETAPQKNKKTQTQFTFSLGRFITTNKMAGGPLQFYNIAYSVCRATTCMPSFSEFKVYVNWCGWIKSTRQYLRSPLRLHMQCIQTHELNFLNTGEEKKIRFVTF